MSMHTAEIELDEAPAAGIGTPLVRRIYGEDVLDTGKPLMPSKAIARAVLIAVPFWVLIGFTIYLLV